MIKISTIRLDADLNPNRTKDGRFGFKGAKFDPMTQAKTRLSNQFSELRKMQREADAMVGTADEGSPAHQRKLAAIGKKRQAIAETQDMIDRLKAEPVKPKEPEKPKVHPADEVLARLQAKGVLVIGDVSGNDEPDLSRKMFIQKLQTLEENTGIDGAKFISSFEHIPVRDGTLQILTPSSKNQIIVMIRGGGGEMSRKFLRGTDDQWYVENDFFELGERHQGQGIGKRVLRDQFESYQGSSIKRVEVFAAMDAGGYTWGRFGFAPTEKYQFEYLSNDLVTRSKNNNDSEGENLARNIKDAKSFRAFVDSSKGKEYLPGRAWRGNFLLNDQASVNRFNAYTGASIKVKD